MVRKMKDSGVEWIGEIPEDWEVKRLQWGLSEIVIKNDPIQTENILSLTKDRGVIPYKDKGNQGNKSKTDCKEYKLAYPNTIVMNSMNVIIGSVGMSDFFGCVSPVYYVYKARKNNDIRFFNYIFQIPKFQDELKKYANGILEIRLRVSSENVLKRQVAIPKYELQKRISDVLDIKIMEIGSIEFYINQEIETLEAYKKSVITEVVTKGLDKDAEMKDSGIEWIGDIPKHWEIVRGKYLFKQRNEKGNSLTLQLLSPTQEFGVIPQSLYEELSGMRAVKLNQSIDLNSLKSIYRGDYCISLRSFQGGFEYSEYDGVVSPAYQVFYKSVQADDRYYKYLFKERGFIEKMNSYTMSLRDGKNIAFNDFGRTFIPYPPFEEQEAIGDYLVNFTKSIDEVIAIKQNQLSLLDEYKKSLIYEYVTGKREV